MRRNVFLNPIVRNCKHCNAQFEISPAQQQKYAEKGLAFPTHCENCRAKKKQVEYVPCKDCGAPFPVSELDREFYEKKGYVQPNRCPECRKKRREAVKK